MLGNGFVNMEGSKLSSPEHHPGGPQLMVQQPTLLGDPPTVPHQTTILSHDAVTRNQDSQMVGGHQPADLPGV
jgi:hypothetical protein